MVSTALERSGASRVWPHAVSVWAMPDRLQASKAAPVAAPRIFIRLLTLWVARMFPLLYGAGSFHQARRAAAAGMAKMGRKIGASSFTEKPALVTQNKSLMAAAESHNGRK